MKICVFGAGAMGGLLGGRLAHAGADVSLIARGSHLDAMKSGGLSIVSTVEGGDQTLNVGVAATDNPVDLGPQDVVVIAVKGQGLLAAAERMAPLFDDNTAIVTAMNGIPYWYFHAHEGPWAGRVVESVDPGGRILELIDPRRAIGCVLYPAAEIVEPGVVRHVFSNKLQIGEPDGSRSARALDFAAALSDAGFETEVRPRIRDDIWIKLWGNLCFNPISTLTGATLAEIVADDATRPLVRQIMVEAEAVAKALGVRFHINVDERIRMAGSVGAHKTSMLQDLEHGRPLEIDGMGTVVQEFSRLVDLPVPTLDMVLALLRQRAATAGCLPGPDGAAG